MFCASPETLCGKQSCNKWYTERTNLIDSVLDVLSKKSLQYKSDVGDTFTLIGWPWSTVLAVEACLC